MNKKGFTLVEILAVIVIIGILSTTIMVNINEYLENSKREYNNNVKKQMIISGKNYYSENKSKIPENSSEKAIGYVTIKELSSLNYNTKNFTDSNDNSCMEESYVVVFNSGTKLDYYACMKCGNEEYITSTEKQYCDAIKNIYINKNTGKDNSPTCSINIEESKYTSTSAKLVLNMNDEDNDFKRIYMIDSDNKNNEYSEEISENTTKKEINLDDTEIAYGIYNIYAQDNNYNTVKCGSLKYEAPKNSSISYKEYIITEQQYNSHKETGFTKEELESQTEYDGKGWKNGYVYVALSYRNNIFEEVKIGTNQIISNDKKYFFITQEGNRTTTLTATSKAGKQQNVSIQTMLDRTKPTINTVLNSSNESWTKNSISVQVSATDNVSKIKSIEYMVKNVLTDATVEDWNSNWNTISGITTSSASSSKTWNKANRKYYMYIRVTDQTGNTSTICNAKTCYTKIYQDITPPKYVTKTINPTLVWTDDGAAKCRQYQYEFDDNLSGVYKLKYGHSYQSSSGAITAYKNKTSWEIRNWEAGRFKYIKYCMNGVYYPVWIYFGIEDRAGNLANFGPYKDSSD